MKKQRLKWSDDKRMASVVEFEIGSQQQVRAVLSKSPMSSAS